MNTALILVDIQNDFCKGGALAVPDADAKYIEFINGLIRKTLNLKNDMLFVATQDFHPENHVSFASTHNADLFSAITLPTGEQQVMWPDHCVEGTEGANFPKDLYLADVLFTQRARFHVVTKGRSLDVDSYSGFFDNNKIKQTALDFILRLNEVDTVYVVGLATDYCVKATCIDAVELGFKTNLIYDGCRGVNVKSGDVIDAYLAMEAKGVKIISSEGYYEKL